MVDGVDVGVARRSDSYGVVLGVFAGLGVGEVFEVIFEVFGSDLFVVFVGVEYIGIFVL